MNINRNEENIVKQNSTLLLFSMLISFFICLPSLTYAEQSDIANIQAQQDELESELSVKETEIYHVLQDIQQIHSEWTELHLVIADNNEQIDHVTKEMNTFEKEIKQLKEEIKTLQLAIEERDEILKTRLSAYQSNGGNASFIEVIFNATSLNDFISRLTAVTQITKADQELIKQQVEDKEEVEKAQAKVEEKLVSHTALKKSYEEKNVVIEEQQANLLTLKNSLD